MAKVPIQQCMVLVVLFICRNLSREVIAVWYTFPLTAHLSRMLWVLIDTVIFECEGLWFGLVEEILCFRNILTRMDVNYKHWSLSISLQIRQVKGREVWFNLAQEIYSFYFVVVFYFGNLSKSIIIKSVGPDPPYLIGVSGANVPSKMRTKLLVCFLALWNQPWIASGMQVDLFAHKDRFGNYC